MTPESSEELALVQVYSLQDKKRPSIIQAIKPIIAMEIKPFNSVTFLILNPAVIKTYDSFQFSFLLPFNS